MTNIELALNTLVKRPLRRFSNNAKNFSGISKLPKVAAAWQRSLGHRLKAVRSLGALINTTQVLAAKETEQIKDEKD